MKTLSLQESRKWLWTRIQAGDREVLNALWLHGKPLPEGVRRLPRGLHSQAVHLAARWLRKTWDPQGSLA